MAPFPNFIDRVAVVTGAASGIGRELTMQLARRGTHVAACDVDEVGLVESTARAARANPSIRVTSHVCDISSVAEVDHFVEEVGAAHAGGVVHLLFNNAGIVGGSSFVTGSGQEWDRVFAVNWSGPFQCTRALLPKLLAADLGVVVNVASVNAVWASLGNGTVHSAYSTAKFAYAGSPNRWPAISASTLRTFRWSWRCPVMSGRRCLRRHVPGAALLSRSARPTDRSRPAMPQARFCVQSRKDDGACSSAMTPRRSMPMFARTLTRHMTTGDRTRGPASCVVQSWRLRRGVA